MSSLRIVHAVRSDGFAGVERHIAVLARAQANRGDRVSVIGGDPDSMMRALKDVPVSFRPGPTTAAVIRSLIHAATDCDILHVHMTAAEFAGSVASFRHARGVPLITTRHFAAHRGGSRVGRLAAGFIAGRVSEQIAISQYVAAEIDGASSVVYPGVESANPEADPRKPVILVVQRLEAEKRTDIAIAAFAHSGLAEQGWRLHIVGEGSLRPRLEEQARELGVGGVVDFLGRRSDISRLMTAGSLLLAPCPIEGLGLVVLEAMAAQLPVVASAAGGHLETLPPEAHPFCFSPNNPVAAAAALLQLAEDPELRDALGSAGLRRQLAHFSPAAQAKATDAVYRRVLARRGG